MQYNKEYLEALNKMLIAEAEEAKQTLAELVDQWIRGLELGYEDDVIKEMEAQKGNYPVIRHWIEGLNLGHEDDVVKMMKKAAKGKAEEDDEEDEVTEEGIIDTAKAVGKAVLQTGKIAGKATEDVIRTWADLIGYGGTADMFIKETNKLINKVLGTGAPKLTADNYVEVISKAVKDPKEKKALLSKVGKIVKGSRRDE
jgi:hypothetical protein